MILLLDNYDSFSNMLADYIRQAGAHCQVYRAEELTLNRIEQLQPTGIVLSPGPETPAAHPFMQQLLARYITRRPILGICLGYQAIGQYFGARLVKGPLPVHGKTSVVRRTKNVMFDGMPQYFTVMRYHSLVMSHLTAPLDVTATTRNGIPMALAHRNLPVCGVQFHPESVLTENGLRIIRNWLRLTAEPLTEQAV